MKYSCALKLNHIFRRLYHTSGIANGFLVLYTKPNKLTINRVGITVSKKIGKAVVRNRAKRRLREVYRINSANILQGYDFVLVARGRTAECPYEKLFADFVQAAKNLGVYKNE